MKIKKLLALLLAFMMTACVFTACEFNFETSSERSSDSEDTEKEEEAVREVVEELIAVRTATIENADELLDGCKDIVEEGSAAYEVLEEQAEDISDESSLELYNAAREKIEIEIKDIEIDDDEATVTVDATEIDPESVEEIFNEKKEEVFTAYIEDNWTYDGEPLTLYIYTNVLTAAEREEVDADFEEYGEIDVDALMLEAVEEAETKTEEQTITLEKVDDEWVITDIE